MQYFSRKGVSQTDSKQIYAQAKYGQYHGPVPKLKFYIKNYKNYVP